MDYLKKFNDIVISYKNTYTGTINSNEIEAEKLILSMFFPIIKRIIRLLLNDTAGIDDEKNNKP